MASNINQKALWQANHISRKAKCQPPNLTDIQQACHKLRIRKVTEQLERFDAAPKDKLHDFRAVYFILTGLAFPDKKGFSW